MLTFKKLGLISYALVLILAFPVLTQAKSISSDEKIKVEQNVSDYFKSINEHNSEKFLNSVADHDSLAKKSIAAKLKDDSPIDFTIEKTVKINDSKYEVYISHTKGGKKYPVIPYDVILQNGQWKFDTSSIYIYPKDVLAKSFKEAQQSGYSVDLAKDSKFYQDVVSENENFLVKKSTTNSKTTDNVSIQSSLSYNFDNWSTDIWSSSGYTVFIYPNDNGRPNDGKNWVLAELNTPNSDGNQYVASQSVSAYTSSSVDWSSYSGDYHHIRVGNFNYAQTGTFNVYYN
jgi:hypothetical protein